MRRTRPPTCLRCSSLLAVACSSIPSHPASPCPHIVLPNPRTRPPLYYLFAENTLGEATNAPSDSYYEIYSFEYAEA